MLDRPAPERRESGEGPRPAFYSAGTGGWRDWWLVLHPPYTAWHLSYVVIGACLAPVVNVTKLLATVLAFGLAVGIGAHTLDELHGRPLRTSIPSVALITASVVSLAGAVALGIAGVVVVGWQLIPFVVAGPLLVVAYNAELFGGAVHNDVGFALSWGSFPVLVAYAAQTGRLSVACLLASAAACALSYAQRALSTPARDLRRRVDNVTGTVTYPSGDHVTIDRSVLLAPLERALRALSWATVLLAAALVVARLA